MPTSDKAPVTLRRVTETKAYADSKPPAQKPEEFKGANLVLVSFRRERGKMGRPGERIPDFFIMSVCYEDDFMVDPELATVYEVSHSGQFFQDFFSNLNPKDLPLAFKFAFRGMGVYME